MLISDMAGIRLDKPSYTGAGERTERTAVAPLKQQKTPFTQNTRTTDHPETSMTDCNHSTTGRMTVTASILASREAYCGGLPADYRQQAAIVPHRTLHKTSR
ncbi:hypothetical protein [Prevotella denticola]|uniref:hypothetical protein n=1 Tax=Prevotella denticola TaxID=28129 RepID=UPI001C602AE2|nr:hypothetical protein [Prevotella denticola]MBW4714949.1 hypothetical protein [Prevotella denticola]MBW4752727.1 hypothetical protein [Prevotella denticola]